MAPQKKDSGVHVPKGESQHQEPIRWHSRSIYKILTTIVLAALCAEVLRLCLSPVYGSIAASRANLWEISLFTISSFKMRMQISLPKLLVLPTAWLSRLYLSNSQLATMTDLLPIFGICIPALQSYLFRLSSMGPVWGPIATICCTSSPLFYLSVLSVLSIAEELYIDYMAPKEAGALQQGVTLTGGYAQLAFIIACYSVIEMIQDIFSPVIAWLIRSWSGTSALFSRFGLQAVVSLSYAILERSYKRLAFFGILPLLHLISINPHIPLKYNTAALNATLQAGGFSLVARQESLTGYISVLDNVKDGFRVMRCDHSLLGGEWINKPKGHPAVLNEPIYAIFLMLEAVRLVETVSAKSTTDNDKNALIVGLGVGTAPAALITHGIPTTIIEIDPVVHDFATRYFDLPQNHTSIIGDAVEIVKDMQSRPGNYNLYYYILHDVFTGGAEPIDLFTQEFLEGLSNLLKPDGVIAINYAGDLLLPSAISAVATILHVFPKCRLFREMPASTPLSDEDFTNLVIFCVKSTRPITFRQPVESDFLASPARQQHLMPQHEVDKRFYERILGGNGSVIRRGQTKELESSQIRSAIGHWYVMRSVLPDVVWENW